MTVAEEVTSKAYYIRHYQKPEWPGVSSGVTVAIGYDLGQASRTKIAADWGKLVSPDMLAVMMSCSGITGPAAKQKCALVRNAITIPWDAAIAVFANRDVPAWTADVIRAVPGADNLNGDLLGVLFDTAYNRGNGWSAGDDRHREMRAIKSEVGSNHLGAVPAEFQSMKRLWPNVGGLQRRCDHRIALWRQGMTASANEPEAQVAPTPAVPDPEVPLNEGPARTKPPASTPAQHGTAGAIVAGSGGAAYYFGLTSTQVVMVVIAAVIIAGGIWFAWYRDRNPA